MDCPHCKVPLMKGMTSCPKCKWDINTEDGGPNHKEWLKENSPEALARKKAEEEERKAKEQRAKEIERQQREEAAKERRKQEQLAFERVKQEQGGYYDYRVLAIADDSSGGVNTNLLQSNINTMARAGYRLVSSFSNTIGVNSSSSGYGGFSSGTNATIDQSILIFEKFIKNY